MADNRVVRSPGRGGGGRGRSRSPRRTARERVPAPPPAPLNPAAGPRPPQGPPPPEVGGTGVLRLLEDVVAEQRRSAARLDAVEVALQRILMALTLFAPLTAEVESGEES